MKFNFELESNENKCFGDYLADNSNCIIEFISDHSKYRVQIFDPDGHTIFSSHDKTTKQINFIARTTGTFQFCVDNFVNKKISLSFSILSGVSAKDYTSLVRLEKMKPMELNLIKLLDTIDEISQEVSVIYPNDMHYKEEKIYGLSLQIFYLSGLVLAITVGINLCEFFHLKRFFANKKIV